MKRQRPGEGDYSRGAIVITRDLPDGYVPPSASTSPDAAVAADPQNP